MSPSIKLIRKDDGDNAQDLASLPNNEIIWTQSSYTLSGQIFKDFSRTFQDPH